MQTSLCMSMGLQALQTTSGQEPFPVTIPCTALTPPPPSLCPVHHSHFRTGCWINLIASKNIHLACHELESVNNNNNITNIQGLSRLQWAGWRATSMARLYTKGAGPSQLQSLAWHVLCGSVALLD